MSAQALAWIFFNLFVLMMLALDLGVFHRKPRVIHYKEAIAWSLFWIFLAFAFNIGIYFFLGKEPALNFLTGYLIEESLSIDNLFVFLLIFKYFQVPSQYLHRVLFWGIVGALFMRALFIAVGLALVTTFHWMLYVFGVFLIYTGFKLAFEKGAESHPENNPIIRLFRRWFPVTHEFHGEKFFIKKESVYVATPLFIALLAVETADIVFALDSIPAIMSITLDPFIIYTSNVFAILGLRSLFFALSHMISIFHHLHYGLSCILIFIGLKMLLVDIYPVPIGIALAVVACVLLISVVASLIFPEKKPNSPS